MQVTPVGEKLKLLPDKVPNEGGISEHIVFRHAVMEHLVNAASGKGPALNREQAISIGNYVLHSSAEETTEEAAPVVSTSEVEAYMNALIFMSLSTNQEYASLARDMYETIKTEVTVQAETGYFLKNPGFFIH
ncbi:MAG: hypothetical protein ACHQT9_00060 [Candidatus Saccharimonadales bacterium]